MIPKVKLISEIKTFNSTISKNDEEFNVTTIINNVFQNVDEKIFDLIIMAENPIKDSPTDVEMAWLRWSGQVAKLFFFVVATSVAISSVVWKPER